MFFSVILFQGPLEARRAALEESLRFHEFKFQIEAERQWIMDHIPAASSQVCIIISSSSGSDSSIHY